MHNLEYLLLVLSRRIAKETKNTELAEAATALASLSHRYSPEIEDEAATKLYKEWREKYDSLLKG